MKDALLSRHGNASKLIEGVRKLKEEGERLENFKIKNGNTYHSHTIATSKIDKFHEANEFITVKVPLFEDGAVYNSDGSLRTWYAKGSTKRAYDRFVSEGQAKLVNNNHVPWEDDPDAGDIGNLVGLEFETFGERGDKGRVLGLLELDSQDNFVQKMIRRTQKLGQPIYSVSSENLLVDYEFKQMAGEFTRFINDFSIEGVGIVSLPALTATFSSVEFSGKQKEGYSKIDTRKFAKMVKAEGEEFVVSFREDLLKKIKDGKSQDLLVNSQVVNEFAIESYLSLLNLNKANNMAKKELLDLLEEKVDMNEAAKEETPEVETKAEESKEAVESEVDSGEASEEVKSEECEKECSDKECSEKCDKEEKSSEEVSDKNEATKEETPEVDTKESEEKPEEKSEEVDANSQINEKLTALEAKVGEVDLLKQELTEAKTELAKYADLREEFSQMQTSLDSVKAERDKYAAKIDSLIGGVEKREKAVVKDRNQDLTLQAFAKAGYGTK